VAAESEKKERRGLGVIGRLVILSLALVGAWVVFGNAYDWARPWWRYATIASISFTVGTFYGRFRRYEREEKRKARS
jgi:hypothetical protein